MEWIKTEEKKPEEYQPVFVKLETGGLAIMSFSYMENGDDSGWIWGTVYDAPYWNYKEKKWECEAEWDDDYWPTHWMPLPQPPKE